MLIISSDDNFLTTQFETESKLMSVVAKIETFIFDVDTGEVSIEIPEYNQEEVSNEAFIPTDLHPYQTV